MKIKIISSLLIMVSFVGNLFAQTAPNWSWARSGQGAGHDYSESISADGLGYCYVTGTYQGPSIAFGSDTLTDPAATNFFLAKYDSLGNEIWARKASNSVFSYGTCVSTDKAGNSYVTGYCTNGGPITFGGVTLVTANASYGTAFIVKYDPLGNVLWAKDIGTVDYLGALDLMVNNAVDADGNVYIVAPFETTSSPNFLLKLNSAGNLVWQKSLIGSFPIYASPNVCTDALGNCYVTGIYGINTSSISFGSTVVTGGAGDIFVVKYDNAGNVIWAKNDGNGGLNFSRPSISVDKDQNVYVSGILYATYAQFDTIVMNNSIGNSTYDSWFVKYNAQGQLSWAKQIGNPSYDETVYCHRTDRDGNTYLTGLFSYFTNFNGVTLTSPNNVDVFVVKYDSSGTALWAQNATGNGADYGKGIAVTPQKSIYVTGIYGGLDCDFSSLLVTNSNTVNGSEVFVAKMVEPIVSTNGLDENQIITSMNIAPNPFSTSARITTSHMQDASLTISNCLGQIVQRKDHLSGSSIVIERDNLPEGLYFLQIIENNSVIGNGKMIVSAN